MAKKLLVLGLAVLFAGPALADPPPAERDAPPPRGDRRDRPPRVVPFLPAGPAGVAATGDFVYVVQGGMLYKFNAGSLELLKKVALPRERRDIGPGPRPREGRRGDRPREREGRPRKGPPDDPQRPRREGDAPPPPRREGERDRPPRDFPPRVVPVFTPVGSPAAVAATGEFVYVTQGRTLYKLNAGSLEILKKVALPRERREFRPGPRPREGRPGDRPRPRGDRPRREDG
jgi:hypothetical protein